MRSLSKIEASYLVLGAGGHLEDGRLKIPRLLAYLVDLSSVCVVQLKNKKALLKLPGVQRPLRTQIRRLGVGLNVSRILLPKTLSNN